MLYVMCDVMLSTHNMITNISALIHPSWDAVPISIPVSCALLRAFDSGTKGLVQCSWWAFIGLSYQSAHEIDSFGLKHVRQYQTMFYCDSYCILLECSSMDTNISQMKHHLDATLCRFYFCRVTLHVLGASAHHQEYLKLVWRPLIRVLSLQVSHHISLLGPPALISRCDDLPATITHVPVAAVLVLNTPDDGRLRPKHLEWLCRNKTCTVLHQVGVSFD